MKVMTDGVGLRYFSGYAESAYFYLKWSRLGLWVEFPSDWHEQRRAWLHIHLLLFTVAFSIRWPWVVPDDGQCSGPRYGFSFFEDVLWIYYGKERAQCGKSRRLTLSMPWAWAHVRHDWVYPNGQIFRAVAKAEYEPPAGLTERHPYVYLRENREIQHRVATINGEEREWRPKWAPWLPWPRMVRRSIDVRFNDETGERTGSWKGGTIGCSTDWKKGETMLSALRRMERERRL